MRLAPALRHYIPVVAHSVSRVPHRVVVRPDVGLRWGAPSQFLHNRQDQDKRTNDSDGSAAAGLAYFDDYKTVYGTEVYRTFDIVRLRKDDADEENYVDVERLRDVIFYLGETEHTVDETINPGDIQPWIVYTKHYIEIAFNLAEETDEIVGSGERGEKPEEPPPPPTTISDEILGVKDFWADVLQLSYN